MIEQIPLYELEIINIGAFSFAINALLLLFAFSVTTIYRDKYKIIRVLQIFSYLLILLGITKLLIFGMSTTPIYHSDFISKVSYYFYSLIRYPIASLKTYFIIYSNLYILAFIPFYLVFRQVKCFIIAIFVITMIQTAFTFLGINNYSFSFYDLFLYIFGFGIGYLIDKVKRLNLFEKTKD